MNYQEAKNIRGKGYISHLTDKLSEGQGLGSALKSTISEKSKARSVGWKEKFDPMNIAKFMTGGSKFAPALLGSMTGRSKEDMQYFAGNSKAKGVGDSATKIGSLESDNKVLDVLLKIYDLMKSTNENDTKRREEENSKKEEIQLEKERRHKELIEAITGKKQKTATPATATKEDSGGGIMATIMGIITGLIGDAIKGVMAVVEGITGFITMLTSSFGGLSKIASLLFNLGRFLLFNPLGIAIVAGAGIAYAVWELWKQSDVEQTKSALAGKGAEGITAAGLGAEGALPSYKEETDEKALKAKAAAFDKKGIAGASLEELTAKHQLMIDYGDPRVFIKKGNASDDQKAKGKLLDDIEAEIKNRNKIPELTEKGGSSTSIPTVSKATNTATESGSEPTSKPAEARQNAGPELMNQIAGATGKLNAVTKENLDLSLPTKPDAVSEAQVTNNTNINKTTTTGPKGPIPSVRNLETSFRQMIIYSTRVV